MRSRGKQLRGIRNSVKMILVDNELARDDDDYLYLKYIEKHNPYLLQMPLEEALLRVDLPYYESIRRSRQWVQQKYPELGGSEQIHKRRFMNERVFRDFARSFKE